MKGIRKIVLSVILAGSFIPGTAACSEKPAGTSIPPSEDEISISKITSEETPAPPFDGSRIRSVDLEGVDCEGIEFALSPDFCAGQDLVVNINSEAELSLGTVFKFDPYASSTDNVSDAVMMWKESDGDGIPGIVMSDITIHCSLTGSGGTFDLTIPAECLSCECDYYVEMNSGSALIIHCT